MTSFDEITKVWKGPKVEYPYPTGIHISEIILKSLKKTPNRILQIYDENGAQLTCEELRLKATRIAQNLAKLGIKQGDVVGFNCSNSENICALLNGCIFLGAILSHMAPIHDKKDLIHMWGLTEPKFVFCDSDVYEKVIDALSNLKNRATVCTLIERKDNVLFVDDLLTTTGIEESFRPAKCKNSEDSVITYSSSSGSTGPAKAVCNTQSYFLQVTDLFSGVKHRFVNFAPIFWNLSLVLYMILPLTNLIRIVTRRSASVENIFEIVEKFQVENLYTTPAVLNQTIQSSLRFKANLSSLKVVTSAGASLHPDLRIKFKETFPGKKLLAAYGATEIVLVWPLLCDKNEGYTVGRPNPNSEIKIVDDDGNNLGVDERGEICGKTLFPFSGYYKNPIATKAALDDDNFFRTGDYGYFDQNGMLNIVDRKKDIFKYNLFHINPTEIENVIQTLDGVELVSVVGIPNDDSHNLTCAAVLKRRDYEHLTKDDVIAYVASRLPEYKQLHGGVIFLESFPMTPTGKVNRRLITELVEQELTS